MKTINIIVDVDGSVEIDAIGFKGSSCQGATKAIEKALGLATDSRKKAEYYQRERRSVQVKR